MTERSWSMSAWAIAGIVALPLITVAVLGVSGDDDGLWTHLASTVLGTYARNSVLLALGVGIGTSVLGISTAWLVATCTFPGRRLFALALLLPMAMPTYLMAYAYTDLLQPGAPLHTALRELGVTLPPIRSLGGAIVTLSFVLYPYVFLLARAAFAEQSAEAIEASRTLGVSPFATWRRVALPLARPGIVAGLALVMMETLAEYGAVEHFAVDTFTTGIYRAWTALGSPHAAAQLACVLLAVVLALLVGERLGRGRARYSASARRRRPLERWQLTGARAWGATLACSAPVVFGFLVPTIALARLAWQAGVPRRGDELPRLAGTTIGLALGSALLIVALGMVVVFARRLRPTRAIAVAARLAGSGYAVPGSVIAVGTLIAIGWIDDALGTFVGGTALVLVLAYCARFLTVALEALDAGLTKVGIRLDDAARTLGAGPGRVLRDVHAPLLRGSLATAALLVFVDVMKELPATLIVRPFGFDTLAVHVHTYASDERLAQAALPALLIVAIGLAPVALLSRAVDRSTS